MYFVYLLKLIDGRFYTGLAKDVPRRVIKHNKGGVISTRGKRPVELVFYCAFPTKKQAADFERYLKTGSGQAFRNKHMV